LRFNEEIRKWQHDEQTQIAEQEDVVPEICTNIQRVHTYEPTVNQRTGQPFKVPAVRIEHVDFVADDRERQQEYRANADRQRESADP
jgi:hypothetical protein